MLQKRKFRSVYVIALICWLCFFLPEVKAQDSKVKKFFFSDESEKWVIAVLVDDTTMSVTNEIKEIWWAGKVHKPNYDKGFNDALESLALLNLELELKGERKTFGEMFDILRRRHGIKQGKK
ncbi:MAG: hypothetical protein KKH44_07715 [Bacteroidetes bacterium]|nr:hypothetical protein [Bacteroidota bacterium]